ncbi:ExbD/TolR family protein [Thalassococcus lentus]|uniref:Biopolymer transporter ExbD n=1 Tax=Thalassococcus lentus TaxID=1210524 RepID=A0ABT4XTT2_9RHOB|nr:biopolymer transporter ExbD [Thalassococcus lentus]MDA7425343.1 biopolymer transporter ExbD [Thalassococcus lentus]
MRFTSTSSRRRQAEPIVPMINVVFLLLIFFLMTAQIAPPEPFEMALPEAEGQPTESVALPLFLSRDGLLAHGEARGADALAAAAAAGPVILQAHAQADAQSLARALSDLVAMGAIDITLVTQEPQQ